MPWTSPKTWSSGETLTAANFNTYIRDNLNYVNTQHKYKAGDTSSTSTTLANDPDLVFAVAASEVWLVQAFLLIDSNATAGYKCTWTVPAGASMKWAAPMDRSGAGIKWAGDTGASSEALLDATATQTYASPSAGSIWGVPINGIVTVSTTAGNVQFQFAQGVASGTTITKAGSLLIAHRVST
jgi:hypothetical protein